MGESLDRDMIIEPVRGPLIPGMMAVKEAAKAAGGVIYVIQNSGWKQCISFCFIQNLVKSSSSASLFLNGPKKS